MGGAWTLENSAISMKEVVFLFVKVKDDRRPSRLYNCFLKRDTPKVTFLGVDQDRTRTLKRIPRHA